MTLVQAINLGVKTLDVQRAYGDGRGVTFLKKRDSFKGWIVKEGTPTREEMGQYKWFWTYMSDLEEPEGAGERIRGYFKKRMPEETKSFKK